jgi:hypothetical protein
MGLKKIKTLLLKPHHIAFSGLSLIIIAALVWYFYSGRESEGFQDASPMPSLPTPVTLTDYQNPAKYPGISQILTIISKDANYQKDKTQFKTDLDKAIDLMTASSK